MFWDNIKAPWLLKGGLTSHLAKHGNCLGRLLLQGQIHASILRNPNTQRQIQHLQLLWCYALGSGKYKTLSQARRLDSRSRWYISAACLSSDLAITKRR